jgi:hypothetical protein
MVSGKVTLLNHLPARRRVFEVRVWLGLPARDWFLLPLTSLMTLILMLAISELGARIFWPEQLLDTCILKDTKLGIKFKPNCHSIVKSAETDWIENSYNDCGFRTAESCGPRIAPSFRVAIIGSSISSGYLIPYGETFAARATESLKRRCGLLVDFQNLAVPGSKLDKALGFVEPALALQPDLLLMALSAHDLEVLGSGAQDKEPASKLSSRTFNRVLLETAAQLRASRAVAVAQHFLYENLEFYLPLYLKHGDEADYLRPPLSSAWKRRLELFNQEVEQIAAQSKAANVQFMLVFVPQRAQAALLQWKHLPSGIDPTLLGNELGEVARRNRVLYLNLTRTIVTNGTVEGLYYAVDSHPNGTASAIIAASILSAMTTFHILPASCTNQSQALK